MAQLEYTAAVIKDEVTELIWKKSLNDRKSKAYKLFLDYTATYLHFKRGKKSIYIYIVYNNQKKKMVVLPTLGEN